MNWALMCLALASQAPHDALIQIADIEVMIYEQTYQEQKRLLCDTRGVRVGMRLADDYDDRNEGAEQPRPLAVR